MNFDYSEEQRMLQDSVVKLLSSHVGADATSGPDAGVWTAYAEAGLLGMAFDEADGGLGLGPVENMIVMRAIGQGLCTSPYLASAVYGTSLLKAAASSDQRAAIVPSLIDGSAQLAVAHAEPGSRYRLEHVGLTATSEGRAFILSGKKTLVLGGAAATHFIVSARTSGKAGDPAGVTLFLVPRSADRVEVAQRRTIDGRSADDLHFTSVRVPAGSMLGTPDTGLEALELATDHAVVATVNEAVGAMEELLAITVDYLKTRRQFGTAIGSFQALQHKAVDMFVEVEQAKSMALYAAMQLGMAAEDRRNAIALSKLHVNRAARVVGETAVQLHGAIGMTMESKAGRLFNRLTACQLMFGDSEFWLASLVDSAPNVLAA
jgi:alkylation response protein AidB-like acyl-CoA dehydrogenase